MPETGKHSVADLPSTRKNRDLLLQAQPPTSPRTFYPSSGVRFSPFLRKGGSPMTLHTLRQRSGQFVLGLFALLLLVVSTVAQNKPDRVAPKFSTAVAFDTSSPVRDLATAKKAFSSSVVLEVRPERGPVVRDKGFSGDGAVQTSSQTLAA